MKKWLVSRILAFVLVLAVSVTSQPFVVFTAEGESGEMTQEISEEASELVLEKSEETTENSEGQEESKEITENSGNQEESEETTENSGDQEESEETTENSDDQEEPEETTETSEETKEAEQLPIVPKVSAGLDEDPEEPATEIKDEEQDPDVNEILPDESDEVLSYGAITGAELPSGVESITTSTLDADTNCSYPWSTYNGESDVFVSGNKGVDNSISTLKVTVKGSGALVYEYKVFSTDTTQENVPDSLLVSVGTEITKDTSYKTFTGDRYYSSATQQEYTRKVIKITAGEDETTNVYFTYKKNGSVNGEYDLALITGIEFNTGTTDVVASVSDEALGGVTGSGTYYAGDSVDVTVSLNEGTEFFGWSLDGKFLPNENRTTYTFIAGTNVSIKAQLGTSATAAQNQTTGDVYSDLQAALDEAQSGDVIEIVNDVTVSGSVEIPTGVTLYVPYDASHDYDGNTDGTTADSANAFATQAKTYRNLTIENGAMLTVKGELLIGGTISYPGQNYSGHTSGAHGRITNNGAINVTGGRIDCYGFIDGTGLVTATTGTVYEPFVVLDFAGGNNTLSLYSADQNPFTQYTMQNISCDMTIKDTAAYGVYCNLYASSQYNKTDALLIGGSATAPDAMILLSEGASVTRTVDKTRFVSGGIVKSGTYGADIGRVTFTVTGGASLNNMAMTIYGVDVSVKQYPIPYCFAYILTAGDYSMPNGWSLLPGAEMVVSSDATLTSAGKFFVLDGLINTGMSGKFYPSSAKLAESGFATNGVLKVNGTLRLKSGSSFGGIVQSDGTGKVVIEDNVTLANTIQVGALTYYDDNTCFMDLPGRVNINGSLTNMISGTTYEATNGTGWTFPSYVVKMYAKTLQSTRPDTGNLVSGAKTMPASGDYKQTGNESNYSVYYGPETVTTNQAMVGGFKIAETVEGFTIFNQTYYDVADHSRTTVSDPVTSGSTATFTVSRTTAGNNYNYLVKVSIGGGDPQTVTPDANGLYTLTGVNGAVTITVISVLKGDVSLNGKLAANDVTMLRRGLAGYTSLENEFSKLAADCNGNGKIAANDVTLLRRFLAGYISQF